MYNLCTTIDENWIQFRWWWWWWWCYHHWLFADYSFLFLFCVFHKSFATKRKENESPFWFGLFVCLLCFSPSSPFIFLYTILLFVFCFKKKNLTWIHWMNEWIFTTCIHTHTHTQCFEKQKKNLNQRQLQRRRWHSFLSMASLAPCCCCCYYCLKTSGFKITTTVTAITTTFDLNRPRKKNVKLDSLES